MSESIHELTRSVVQNMSNKNAERVETASQQIITQVKETVVKEVIRENLDVDLTGLATKDEVEASKYDDTDIKTSISEVSESLNDKANKTDVYTKDQLDVTLSEKADKTEIPDISNFATKDDVASAAYDDTEIKTSINSKADKETTYTKDEVLSLLEAKANLNDIYSKAETYTKDMINELLEKEADLTDVYTRAQTDEKLAEKLDKIDAETFATTNDVNIMLTAKANKSEIPDVSVFAKTEDVNALLDAKANTADVNEGLAAKANKEDIPDVSNFATKTEVTDAINNIEMPDISGKADISSVNDALALKADKIEIPDISNLATKDEVALKADKTDIPDVTPYATKTSVSTALSEKADKASLDLLATKQELANLTYDDTEIKSEIASKADKDSTYTKEEVVDLLAAKANLEDIYSKAETYTKEMIDGLLEKEADLTDVYTRAQSDAKFAEKNEIPDVSEFLKAEDIASKAEKSEIPDVSEFITANDIANKADKSEIPDISNKADKMEVAEALALKVDASSLDNLATKDAVALKADKTEIPDISDLVNNSTLDTALSAKADIKDLFKNGVFYVKQTDDDGSYNLFWQEKNSGGGNQYFNAKTNTLSYVGVNKPSTAGSDVDIQLYSKDKDTNIGLRVNLSATKGMFYLKNSTNLGFPEDREVAVKGDIPDVSNFATINDLVAKADKSELPDVSTLATKNELAEKANSNDVFTKTEMNSLLSSKLDASKVWNNNGYFDTTNTKADGSYAKLWNENSGGGVQALTKDKDTLSFVGVNHWSDGDKVACQIYTKNKTTNIGVRMSFNPELGAFYSKGVTGGNANNFAPGREIAVKDDISALIARIEELEAKVAVLEGN